MSSAVLCSADGNYEVSYKPNVVVYSSGDVLWIPPAIYKSSCQQRDLSSSSRTPGI